MMTEQSDENLNLRKYLVGTLDDAATERFDQLSISDDQFVTTLAAAEHDLVDQYAAGTLSAPERKQFEAHYLASPLRRSRMGFGRALRTFLDGQTAATATKSLPLESTAKRRVAPRVIAGNHGRGFARYLTWGFAAASISLAALTGWLVIANHNLRAEINEARNEVRAPRPVPSPSQTPVGPAPNVEVIDQDSRNEVAQLRAELSVARRKLDQQRAAIDSRQQGEGIGLGRASDGGLRSSLAVVALNLAPQLRGGTEKTQLALTGAAKTVAIRLTLEPGAAEKTATYIALLKTETGAGIVWTSRPLRVVTSAAAAQIKLNIPARLLSSRGYVLELYNAGKMDDADAIVDAYPFTVVR